MRASLAKGVVCLVPLLETACFVWSLRSLAPRCAYPMLLSHSTGNRMLRMLTLVSVQARVLPGSISELLAQYGGNPSTRPGLSRFGDGSQDLVVVNFGIDRYHGINQRAQTWGLTGYMRAEWHDTRLAFNETAAMTGKLTLFPAQAAQVWQPDIYFENYVSASSISGTDGYGESLTIYPDGRVVRSQQRSFTFACALRLGDLPFDVQQCDWTLGLYSSTMDQVLVQWANNTDALAGWDTQRCSSEWAAVAMHQENAENVYPLGTFSYAKASVTFVRAQPENIVNRYVFVGVALVFLSYLGAWINPAATPARVALSIITILTVVNNYQSLMLQLPVNQSHPASNRAVGPNWLAPTHPVVI